MRADLVLHNGRVVTDGVVLHGGVAVADGKIAAVLTGDVHMEAERVVNLDGRLLFPGVVDAHVHFSEVGRDFEGYLRGSQAAAAGGVTTVLEMPLNDLPPTTTRERLREKRLAVENLSVVDYAHWGGFIDDNLDELRGMHEDGVIGFKAFMKEAKDFPHIDDGLLEAGLREVASSGSVLGIHAENDAVLKRNKIRLQAAGRNDRAVLEEWQTKDQELDAISRVIFWASRTGGAAHIVHISIAEGVEAIARARAKSVNVTGEVCAHHLCLDAGDHDRQGTLARCSPPLRDRAEVERLWECVLAGDVDLIASDHSPFGPDSVRKGMDDVWQGGGIRGVQSTLPAMATEGVHKRGMSWPKLAQLLAGNPARIFGVADRKGRIAPGMDADFVVIEPHAEWILQEEDLFSKYPLSPYTGRTYKGRIDETYVRGTAVYQHGKIGVEPGYGRLLRRSRG